jgi:plastocyanin
MRTFSRREASCWASLSAIAMVLLLGVSVASADQGVLITEGNAADVATWQFTPANVTIAPGESITWINSGAQGHTATADDGATFDTDVIPPDQSKSVAFSTAGTFAYHCKLYPSMTGSITVSQATAAPTAPTAGIPTLAATAPPPAVSTPAPQALATPTPAAIVTPTSVVTRPTATALPTAAPPGGGTPDNVPAALLVCGAAAIIAGSQLLRRRRQSG